MTEKIDSQLKAHVCIQWLAHHDLLVKWMDYANAYGNPETREKNIMRFVDRDSPFYIFSFSATKEGMDFWDNKNYTFIHAIARYEKEKTD